MQVVLISEHVLPAPAAKWLRKGLTVSVQHSAASISPSLHQVSSRATAAHAWTGHSMCMRTLRALRTCCRAWASLPQPLQWDPGCQQSMFSSPSARQHASCA